MKFLVAAVVTAAMVIAILPIRESVNLATVALLLVAVVMGVAFWLGRAASLLSAGIAAICFNFFFIQPLYTFRIGTADDVVTFILFIATGLFVGQLSAVMREKAAEAEDKRVEAERLYQELNRATEEASDREAIRKSEKLKSALLEAVTHDLRTPLTSIKASATSLLRSKDGLASERNKDLLEVIVEESDRLNEFVEAMLELARLEAGDGTAGHEPVALHDVIDAALDRAQYRLKNHQVEITIESSLPRASLDAQAIAEVIFTLLDNAANYSPTGSRIHLTAKRIEGYVQVTVEDEGAGIPVYLREKVFEKFFRTPTRYGTPGFGMGLAIAKAIVEAHGGRIWIEGKKSDLGVMVSFTLPLKGGIND